MTTTPLSPVAQAVLDAFCADSNGVYLEGDPERLAAALRAAVDQVLPEQPEFKKAIVPEIEMVLSDCINNARAEFLAIANELDPQP